MRTRKLAIIALMLIAVPMAVNGQRMAGTLAVEGFGGIGYPLSPEIFSEYWKLGYGFGGGLRYNFTDMTALGASFTYQMFALNEDNFLEMMEGEIPAGVEVELSGASINMSIISANLIQYLTPPDAALGLYILAGGGYYMASISDLVIKANVMGETYEETQEMEDEFEDKFGVNGGLGIEFWLGGKLYLFIEGKYHYLFGEEEGWEGVADGGTISFATGMGGIRINL